MSRGLKSTRRDWSPLRHERFQNDSVGEAKKFADLRVARVVIVKAWQLNQMGKPNQFS